MKKVYFNLKKLLKIVPKFIFIEIPDKYFWQGIFLNKKNFYGWYTDEIQRQHFHICLFPCENQDLQNLGPTKDTRLYSGIFLHVFTPL